MKQVIRLKERETIIQSLRSGVVPRIGLQHIQVGRSEELKSFVKDVETIADGGASFRLVIGDYGSGKTFFLSLVRSIALEKGLVTMNADLSPSKRLYGNEGQARRLLAELVTSLSTRTKQDGNALTNILEKFISIAQEKAAIDDYDYCLTYGYSRFKEKHPNAPARKETLIRWLVILGIDPKI